MMKRKPVITIEDNTIFLTLDLKGLDLYERGKAIRRFINSDTKLVEDYADRLCKAILKRNGIILQDTSESAYIKAINTLVGKGKNIEIVDFYENTKLDNCEYVQRSENKITVLLEDNRYLQAGVEVREVDIYV